MKISLGLAACALLAASLAASAEPSAKPRFKQNGDPCTAEEVANPPVVKVRVRGRILDWKIQCLTKGEWNFARSAKAEQDRAMARWNLSILNTAGPVPHPNQKLPPR
jgi:hypothetical protein